VIGNPYLFGYRWHTYPRGWVDVIRCRLGYHRAIMTGYVSEHVDRCSCGAIRFDGETGVWLPEQDRTWRTRRKGMPIAAGKSINESELL
jgi:hypothetical protein